ncbi:hypothetical protein PV350_37165 [Streptomyces sp. PA03-6a]|nr:hypothetical protein [Streptomyces sp. PA03-6a]
MADSPGTSSADAALSALSGLARLPAERPAVADQVAAAEYGTAQAVDDPAAAAARAQDLGADPAVVRRVFAGPDRGEQGRPARPAAALGA